MKKRAYCEVYAAVEHLAEVERILRQVLEEVTDAHPEYGMDLELPNEDFWTLIEEED